MQWIIVKSFGDQPKDVDNLFLMPLYIVTFIKDILYIHPLNESPIHLEVYYA
jgi:hypothetical protein